MHEYVVLGGRHVLVSPSFILSKMTGKNSCAVALPGSYSKTGGGSEGKKRREGGSGGEGRRERGSEGGGEAGERQEGKINCIR